MVIGRDAEFVDIYGGTVWITVLHDDGGDRVVMGPVSEESIICSRDKALYAALDEPDADVTHILGLLADAYMDAGDEWRSECLRWCVAEGKRPSDQGWSRDVLSADGVPRQLFDLLPCNLPWDPKRKSVVDYARLPGAYQRLADAWHALRTRGEEPVAGLTREGVTTAPLINSQTLS